MFSQGASLPKSSVLQFFLDWLFCGLNNTRHTPSEPTVYENYVQDIYVDEQFVELSLWDTAGMRHSAVTRGLNDTTTNNRARRIWQTEIFELCGDARRHDLFLGEPQW